MAGYPFADLALARRLERAEAESGARFVEARARLVPESGAGGVPSAAAALGVPCGVPSAAAALGCPAWIDVAGTYAMFDGPASPVTQTFGFGLFATPTEADLVALEAFFRDRSAPVFHEISPLADPAHLRLLSGRGYHPFEYTSVLYRPIGDDTGIAASPSITVTCIEKGEDDLWAAIAAKGWSDTIDLGDFLLGIGRVNAERSDTSLFLAVHEGTPIAAGALCLFGRVAILAGASTIPEGRHRGAQLALLASRLSYAAERGCDLAMMGALPGSGSQRNAERHGFRVAYTRTKWRQTARTP